MQPKVTLSGASIAVIRDSDNETSSIVIFRPSAETRKLAQKFEGQDVELVIDDTNGSFTPQHAQRIVDSVFEAGNNTMIVTTENQE